LGFASWAAFAVASLLHISHAYWAAMTVWVIFQTTRGLMIMRGFWRIAGTIVGAALGFAILHMVGDPYVQILCLSLWIGGTASYWILPATEIPVDVRCGGKPRAGAPDKIRRWLQRSEMKSNG